MILVGDIAGDDDDLSCFVFGDVDDDVFPGIPWERAMISTA